MTTVTLTEPPYAGTYEVHEDDGGRLMLDPIGPTVKELARRTGGTRMAAGEVERELGELPRDGEG